MTALPREPYCRYERGRWPEICFHTIYAPPLGPRATVLDLGASSAGFSRALARLYGCTCHAVEALPRNLALIAETPLIRRHLFAIGATDGPVELHSVAGEFSSGALSLAPGQTAVETVRVPGSTLAGMMARLGLARVDVLKVDIEGAEYAMFDAADDATLKRCAQISVEFHDFMDPRQEPAVRRIVARLRQLGFWPIKFTGRHHGDVLFLDPARAGISRAEYEYARLFLRYVRGGRRIAARTLRL